MEGVSEEGRVGVWQEGECVCVCDREVVGVRMRASSLPPLRISARNLVPISDVSKSSLTGSELGVPVPPVEGDAVGDGEVARLLTWDGTRDPPV